MEATYSGARVKYLYMNPVFPCILQYFNSKNYPAISISVTSSVTSSPSLSNIRVGYRIEGVMDYFVEQTAENGVEAGFRLNIKPEQLFENEARDRSLSLKIQFENAEGKHEEVIGETIKIASKNSILWSKDFINGNVLDKKRFDELIAAFVTPNDRRIKGFLKGIEVSGLPKNEKGVLTHLKAVYDRLTEEGFRYQAIGRDLVGDQLVQLPFETIGSKRGDCIEGSILMASLTEALLCSEEENPIDPSLKERVHPLIAFIPGHAFFGFEGYPGKGEFYFLETTDLGRKSFEDSIRHGFRLYQENQEEIIIVDIEEARGIGIMPILTTD
ncbi:MAG: hypothetical protein AAB267_03390 [Candidatus Desantisbacteria bacterium]